MGKGGARANISCNNLYSGNGGWNRCPSCGQTLVFREFDIAVANPQIWLKKTLQKSS